ncbi:MAG: coproporphyrinogen III oxidase [Flavobacteriales bacterium MED-G22]|nr:MAG: coproporphyrinogen III oxidase [Flavobacteriales bacterium MED-G22]
MAGIYIHYPFCKQACHYCNFHFSTQLKHQEAVLESMFSELEMRSSFLSSPIESIYFGGGSPSLLNSKWIERWLELISMYFELQPKVEITLEVNPDDATKSYLNSIRQAGVNRISLGIQTFDAVALKLMNRIHTVKQSKTALEITANMFSNYSIDLIYGIPDIAIEQWNNDINNALFFNPAHISSYALTVEPKTVLAHQIDKGQIKMSDDQEVKIQYDHLVDRLCSLGYDHYELSNFGKPNYYSINNSNYWTGKPYLGIGPGAHSFDGKNTRCWNVSNNQLYVKKIKDNVLPLTKETLKQKERFNEYVMTRLRTMWGISLEEVTTQFGVHFSNYVEKQTNKHLLTNNVYWDGDSLKIKKHARFLTDGIASDFFIL